MDAEVKGCLFWASCELKRSWLFATFSGLGYRVGSILQIVTARCADAKYIRSWGNSCSKIS